jgi:hypothetical protein
LLAALTTEDGRRPVTLTPAGHVTSVPCSCCRRSPRGLSGHLRISLPLRPPPSSPPGAAERRGSSCNRSPWQPAPTPPAAAEPRSRNRSSATSSSSPPSTPLASGTRSHAAQVSHMHRVLGQRLCFRAQFILLLSYSARSFLCLSDLTISSFTPMHQS